MWEGWRSECGSRLFYLETIIAVLHPLSSKHGQVTHQCEHYLQSYFLAPIYMRCPSTLFHLGRLFLSMKGKANVHVDDEWTMSAYVGIKTGSNLNSATVHKLYASSQRLSRGTNQNETLLCWILWMSASTYSSTNLFQAPSVRTVEDDTLIGCDG